MMIADGLGGAVFLLSLIWGALTVIIAILLEAGVFRLVLRRVDRRIIILIIGANVVSAFVGGLPSSFRESLLRWDVTADPWEIYQHYWHDFLPPLLYLFGITCIVELACVLPLVRTEWGGFRIARLMAASLLGNGVSYTLLTVAIWCIPPRQAGDFELHPDTSWMIDGARRVWFVDPASERL